MRRLESLHLSLPLPGRLMGHFRPIIVVLSSVVVSSLQDFPDGRRVASQPIGNRKQWLSALALQCFVEDSPGSKCIMPPLYEDVDHVAVLADGSGSARGK